MQIDCDTPKKRELMWQIVDCAEAYMRKSSDVMTKDENEAFWKDEFALIADLKQKLEAEGLE